jgi:hypothetical protein
MAQRQRAAGPARYASTRRGRSMTALAIQRMRPAFIVLVAEVSRIHVTGNAGAGRKALAERTASPANRKFDHFAIVVSNLGAARRFYTACLAPFEIDLLEDHSQPSGEGSLVFGSAGRFPFFVVAAGRPMPAELPIERGPQPGPDRPRWSACKRRVPLARALRRQRQCHAGA